MKIFGDMYAFGLLGAFVFSSLSLDLIRWHLGRRDWGFWLGVFTTGLVMVAWGINLIEKQLATYFGGAVTLIGMLTAVGVRRAWFVDLAGAHTFHSTASSPGVSRLRRFSRGRIKGPYDAYRGG